MSTRVSVIATVYNGEPYFNVSIPGILAQTYTDFEFVIVEDGSTDQTPQLLQELASRDSRVRVLSPGRMGRIKALNYAVEQAQGEYIVQQDFDDVSYPERIRLQTEFLDAHPAVGWVGAHYILVDQNRGERYVRMPPTEHEQIIRAMTRYIPFAHTLVTFRKKAWLEAGGYPDVPGTEDFNLAITIARLKWRLANIPEVLGEHWVYPQSFWHQTLKYRQRQKFMRQAHWRAIRELKLPLWMAVYPLGRYVYSYLPDGVKRAIRRSLGGSKERDVPSDPA
jgi:glycosyltransferase involved in cell wall biosynthesis